MRAVRSLPEVLLVIVGAALLAVNAVLYGGIFAGVIVGEDAGPPRNAASRNSVTSASAEQDSSGWLPGRFVPTQGRKHTAPYEDGQKVPFCPPDDIRDDCYASNPPSSGLHVPVQALIRLPDGNAVPIPPNPGVYEFAIPREAIPHIQEHAGVYLGYNCTDDPCRGTVSRIGDLVTQENSLGARVVMSPDPDLDANTVGIAAWTRVDEFPISDYSDQRVRAFIKAHSCRFDPEGFCPKVPVN